jgi:phosphoserine phosphatase RsbU/P
MVYGVLNPETRTLTFSSAGHLRPLLIENSHARFLDTERGMPLGIGTSDYSEAQVHLRQGSRLLFYSDGITEATNLEEDEYGAVRLEKHFRQSDASAESILKDVRSFANGAGLHDDATVILVKA